MSLSILIFTILPSSIELAKKQEQIPEGSFRGSSTRSSIIQDNCIAHRTIRLCRPYLAANLFDRPRKGRYTRIQREETPGYLELADVTRVDDSGYVRGTNRGESLLRIYSRALEITIDNVQWPGIFLSLPSIHLIFIRT